MACMLHTWDINTNEKKKWFIVGTDLDLGLRDTMYGMFLHTSRLKLVDCISMNKMTRMNRVMMQMPSASLHKD